MTCLWKVVFILIVSGITVANNDIMSICTPVQTNFKTLSPSVAVWAWNMRQEFDASTTVLGSGSFGLVKSVPYGIDGIGSVAIKLSKFKNAFEAELAGKELRILSKINKVEPQIAPRLYGCQYEAQYDAHSKRVIFIQSLYIVQQKMGRRLDQAAKDYKNWSKTRRLRLQIEIVEALSVLWQNGFQHADIKTDNIMLTEDEKHALLIDFNLAQENTSKLGFRGTPKYMPPDILLRRPRLVEQKDDAYSWAIVCAAMESSSGLVDQVWIKVDKKCYDSLPDAVCMNTVAEGAGKIMDLAGWGPVQNGVEDQGDDYITVATLIRNIIKYDRFTHGFEYILKILRRNYEELIDPSLKKKPVEQAPKNVDAPETHPVTKAFINAVNNAVLQHGNFQPANDPQYILKQQYLAQQYALAQQNLAQRSPVYHYKISDGQLPYTGNNPYDVPEDKLLVIRRERDPYGNFHDVYYHAAKVLLKNII